MALTFLYIIPRSPATAIAPCKKETRSTSKLSRDRKARRRPTSQRLLDERVGNYSAGRERPPAGLFIVCRAWSTAWRCKSSSQPDGGEVIAKRKGEITPAARRGLKEARSKDASRWTRTGYEAGSVRASWQLAAKPLSIKGTECKSSGCASKAVELTSGVLPSVLDSRLRGERSLLIRWQESAEGVVAAKAAKARTVLERG